MGGILKIATLADKVINFSKIKLRKATIKVPRLKIKKKKLTNQKEQEHIPNSSIINILIKAAIDKAKREKKAKVVEEDRIYKLLKEDRAIIFNGGYGTASKVYGTKQHTTYVDYGKLFSYLGKFKSQSPYEKMTVHVASLNKTTESGSFVLADRDAMDKIGRFDRYMKTPVMAIQTMALSLVPIAGLSSAEWEEIKNLMRFDSVMYTLKSKTS